MKIKRIISLIESLNLYKRKQLFSYLNEEMDLTQYPPEIQKLIAEKNVQKIAKMIEDGELEETKDLLMLQDNNGWSVDHWLSSKSDKGETFEDWLKKVNKV